MKKVLILLIVAALLLTAGCVAIPTIPAATEGPVSTAPTALPETTTAAPETAPVTTEAPVPTEPAATEAPVTEAPSTEALPTTTAAPEPIDPWSLLGEASFEQGSFTDEFGYNYTWSYDLPCLLADTPDARAINAEIDEVFGAHVREAMADMDEGYAPWLLSVGFNGHVWEDILTIEVIEHTEWDFDSYGIYCYSASTGKRLTTADVIARMGYTQDEFLDACRIQFRQYYADMYSQIPEEERTQYGYYQGMDRQITSEFVNMDLMAFPENDDIAVIAPIVSLAGADYYYHVIYLGMGGSG